MLTPVIKKQSFWVFKMDISAMAKCYVFGWVPFPVLYGNINHWVVWQANETLNPKCVKQECKFLSCVQIWECFGYSGLGQVMPYDINTQHYRENFAK